LGDWLSRLCLRSCAKSADERENEDASVVSRRLRRIALCDGASISFDSRLWAQCLARAFVRTGTVTPGSLGPAMQLYDATHGNRERPWHEAAAMEAGSFATLLGFEWLGTRRARLCAVGDTNAFLLRARRVRIAWPCTAPDDFGNSPSLVGSRPKHNQALFAGGGVHTTEWALERGDTFILATDAVAEWVVSDPDRRSAALVRAARAGAVPFRALIDGERRAARMKRDDSTVIIGGA
jgi:hypothetical protein